MKYREPAFGRSHVPCEGCTACCQNDLLMLHPELGDNPDDYETMEAHNPLTGKIGLALKHKPEGGCWYLGEKGCTIHDRAPAICQKFDCRKFYLDLLRDTSRKQRRKMLFQGIISKDILTAARRRVGTL